MLRVSTTDMENSLTRKIKTREAAVKVIKKFFDDTIITIYTNYNDSKHYKLLAAERTVKSKYETVAEISKEILELIDEENFEIEYEKNTEFDLYYHEKHIELANFIKEKEATEDERTVAVNVVKSNDFKWSNTESGKYSSVISTERSNHLEYETVNELTSNEVSNEILELFDADSIEHDYENKHEFDLFSKKKRFDLPQMKKQNAELNPCYVNESTAKYEHTKEIDAYYVTRSSKERATKYESNTELDAYCSKEYNEPVNKYKTNSELDDYYNEQIGSKNTYETNNDFDVYFNEYNKSEKKQEDPNETDEYLNKEDEPADETKTEFDAHYDENNEPTNDYGNNIEIDPPHAKKTSNNKAKKNDTDAIESDPFYNNEKHMEFAKFFKDIDFKEDNSIHRFSKANVMILPNMNIRTFNGDPTQWKSFLDTFECEIDNNEDISNTEKMNYLINNLSGESESFIKGLNLCKENYQMAFQLLKERYDDNSNNY